MTVRESNQLSRLPQYLYLAPLFAGRRVLEVGSGSGHGAHHLATAGASRVVAVDQSRDAVADARNRFRARNLEFQVAEYANLGFEAGSFDVVVVPRGGPLVGWLGFLEEARRVLAKDGILVIAASAPRGQGGVAYEDMVARLEPLFGRVRMVAVSPFIGLSVVEYAQTAAAEEVEDMVMDTTLAPTGEEQVLEYVAVAGSTAGKAWPFAVYQLPSTQGVTALGDVGLSMPNAGAGAPAVQAKAAPAAAPAPAVDAEAQRKVTQRLKDLEAALARAEAGERKASERLAEIVDKVKGLEAEANSDVAKRLRAREEELAQTLSENQGLRWQVAELEGRLEERGGASVSTPVAASAPVGGAGASLEQLAQVALLHEQAMQESREAIEERDAYIEELRAELEDAQRLRQRTTRQLEEAQGLASRTDNAMREVRQKAAIAEGELLKLRLSQGGGLSAAPVSPRAEAVVKATPSGNGTSGRVTNVAPPPVTVGPERAQLEAELDKATRSWKAAEARSSELSRTLAELQGELERARREASGPGVSSGAGGPGNLEVARDAVRLLREDAQQSVNDLRKTVEAGQRRLRMEVMEIIGTPTAETGEPLAIAHAELEEANRRVAELTAQLQDRGGAGGGAGVGMTAATSDKLDELDEIMAILAAGVREEELRLEQIERGLREVRGNVGQAPAAARGDASRLDALQAELGQRDAELAVLHAEASRAKQRVSDLVERIRGTRDRVWGRSAAEVAGLLDELLAQARGGMS